MENETVHHYNNRQ